MDNRGLNRGWSNIFREDRYSSSSRIVFRPDDTEKTTSMRFCTGSSYRGGFNSFGFVGLGVYIYPHGAIYKGQFKDGQFHGEGVIHFPKGQRLEGSWQNGKLTKYTYKYADGLDYTRTFNYLTLPDRSRDEGSEYFRKLGILKVKRVFLRCTATFPAISYCSIYITFALEIWDILLCYNVGTGLNQFLVIGSWVCQLIHLPKPLFSYQIEINEKKFGPPGEEHIANSPQDLAEGCYDTGDGSYDPARHYVMKNGHILRIVTPEEDKLIKHLFMCNIDKNVGFRPNLYEYWTTGSSKENRHIRDDIELWDRHYNFMKIDSDTIHTPHYAGTDSELTIYTCIDGALFLSSLYY